MSHAEAPFSGVKTVLVVISSKAMAFDQGGLRNLITHAYPGAVVFFVSVSGDPVGVAAPTKVDLVIDFTEPGARQSKWFAPSMRRTGKFVVGRKSGWFYRKSKYDRIYDSATDANLPKDYLESEAWAQKRVLELSGVPVVRHGGVTQDLSKEIASMLPPIQSR
ncbi:MAG: hypothetical protein KGP28_01030 [Bdellovibrionales bacterium]|nr:hypothetical protein [Bdellovibrionales bacterium]